MKQLHIEESLEGIEDIDVEVTEDGEKRKVRRLTDNEVRICARILEKNRASLEHTTKLHLVNILDVETDVKPNLGHMKRICDSVEPIDKVWQFSAKRNIKKKALNGGVDTETTDLLFSTTDDLQKVNAAHKVQLDRLHGSNAALIKRVTVLEITARKLISCLSKRDTEKYKLHGTGVLEIVNDKKKG